jgi:uncharacterized CHY-type Zn-finger protein
MNSECEFAECGPCGGAVIPHGDIKWRKHPIGSDKPGDKSGTVSVLKEVMMCGTHRNKLSVQYGDGEGGLPCIYGFDEADAFDTLINTLEHTDVSKGYRCYECGFSLKYYANDIYSSPIPYSKLLWAGTCLNPGHPKN